MSQSLYPSSHNSPQEPNELPIHSAEPMTASAAASVPEEKSNQIIGPTMLVAVGVQLFVLGLLLALFSHNGSVLLKWDARLWFLYIFASIPFLVFGYRSIAKL